MRDRLSPVDVKITVRTSPPAEWKMDIDTQIFGCRPAFHGAMMFGLRVNKSETFVRSSFLKEQVCFKQSLSLFQALLIVFSTEMIFLFISDE
jgi:hypothetical protein